MSLNDKNFTVGNTADSKPFIANIGLASFDRTFALLRNSLAEDAALTSVLAINNAGDILATTSGGPVLLRPPGAP
jgi:hypothetical protein